MRKFKFSVPLLLVLLSASLATAQDLADHPGYFPVESLDALAPESLNIEINLRGPMIKFVAMATADEDPEFSELVSELEAITVRIAELDAADGAKIRPQLSDAAHRLAAGGWETMVRVREEDEEIHIFTRMLDEEMQGMTVLTLDTDEVTLINLVGKIDLAGLAHLARGLDVPQLEHVVENEVAEGE